MSKTRGYWHRKQRGLDITRLMARDGDGCSICGSRLDRSVREVNHPRCISFDHILPRSRGGTTELSNLRLAHRDCNSARGNDPLVEEPEVSASGGGTTP